MLFSCILQAHDIDRPSRQLRRQAHVLTGTTNGLRQVILGYRYIHGAAIFVDNNRFDFGRRHAVDHQLGGIVVPKHDIDSLIIQLIGHGLHSRTPHADTGPNRINPLVVCLDRDLGARAGVTGRGANLDDFFSDFRHLDFEQLDEHFCAGTAQNQLGAAGFGADFLEDGTHSIVHAKGFTTDKLFAWQQAFRIVTQIDDDIVAGHFFNGSRHQLIDSIYVLLDHLCTLCIAHALHDNLLRRLRCNTPELHVFDIDLVNIAWLKIGILFDRFLGSELGTQQCHLIVRHYQPASLGHVVAGCAIDGDLNIGFFVVTLLGRGRQRQFNRLEDNILGHSFLIGYGFSHQQNFFTHHLHHPFLCRSLHADLHSRPFNCAVR